MALRRAFRYFFIIMYIYPLLLWAELILIGIFVGILLIVGIFEAITLSIIGNLFLAIGFFVYLRRAGRYQIRQLNIDGDQIILNVRAPFIDDRRRSLANYLKTRSLGDRFIRKPFNIICLVHNISKNSVKNISLEIKYQKNILDLSTDSEHIPILESGEIKKVEICITPLTIIKRSTRIEIIMNWDGGRIEKRLSIRSISDPKELQITGYKVSRWKHGLFGGFVWRADVDGLCDLFNHEIFAPAIELSKRFAVPASLFISGRLCLNYKEWKEWVEHFPEKYLLGKPTKPQFQLFVDLLKLINADDTAEYPLANKDVLTAQIGGHMYHHYYGSYGFSASKENNWKTKNVGPGEGFYSWENEQPESKTRQTELRDNILANRKILEAELGVIPKTWAAPGDVADAALPQILEDIGILGASEATPRENPLRDRSLAPYQPKAGVLTPYHPLNSNIIETQAHIHRFDPHTVTHVICIKKAIKFTLETNKQMVLVMHPHLRIYTRFFGKNTSVSHFEEILRHLVEDRGSVMWITTHYNIIKYWEDVLCESHRKIKLQLTNEDRTLEISNSGEMILESIPVDLELSGRKKTTFLVDIEPKSTVRIEL